MVHFIAGGCRRRLVTLLVSLVALVPGAAWAQGNGSASASVASASLKLDEYAIGAHDLLELSVFQVPDLSRTVRVNSRGLITLPLIGVVEAGGLTAQQLELLIAKKLSQDYLQDPQVSVFIKEYVSQRVVVEGSVKKAGVYPLSGRTTLLQVIAMAEGVDPLANENAVKVFREGPGGEKLTEIYDLEAIRSGKVENPQIKGNDLVVVEQSPTRATIKTVTDSIRGILSFGRY